MSYRPHPTRPGWYYVEYRPHGYKGKLERLPVEGIDKAIELDARLKGRTRQTAAPQTMHPKIKDVVDQYLLWVKGNQSPATYRNKHNRLTRYIIPAMGDCRVRDLSQTILDDYAAQHSRAVYKVDHNCLMALVGWMIKRKLAAPLTWKPEAVSISPKVRTIPAPADILRMLAAIPKEDQRMLFTLILFAALRWSEARLLRWENVNVKTGLIRIAEVEGGTEDVTPIPEVCRPWFEANQQAEGWVFRSSKKPGKPYFRLDFTLNAACDAVGIPHINPHLLRHASATLLYQATGDIYAVQHHLRHSKVATSQIYTRYSVEQKRIGMDRLIEHVLNNKKPADAL